MSARGRAVQHFYAGMLGRALQKRRLIMKKQRFIKGLLILMAFDSALVLTSCGAGKTLVMRPPDAVFSAKSVEIIEETPTVKVPEKARRHFMDKLENFIFVEGGLEKGPSLRISCRFIQFNPGNQFTRWFWGGIGNAGKGSMTVEAKYFDGEREISVIQAEGKIQSGAFGGDFDFAIEKAAREIATYTLENFK